MAQAQAQVAYASENDCRHKHQNQPWYPPFCSNAQTRGIWNECFNWPDEANFLVFMLFRFHTMQANASISNRRNFDLCACAYACIRPIFTVKYKPLLCCTNVCTSLVLVLPVKSRLKQ